MSKKFIQVILSFLLLVSISAQVSAEGASVNSSISGEPVNEYTSSRASTYESEITNLKAQIENYPEDEILQEAKKYLEVKPEIKGNSILAYHEIDVVLFDRTGDVHTLDEHVRNLEMQRSNRGIVKQETSDSGIVFSRYLTSNLDTRKVEHYIEYVGNIGFPPEKVNVTNRLETTASRDGGVALFWGIEKNPNMKEGDKLVSTAEAKTRFFRGTIDAFVVTDGLISDNHKESSDKVLFNFAAMPYPEYADSHSGKKNHEPSTSWSKVKNPVSWTSEDRRDYIAWYVDTYGDPGWKWSDYDIHHIRPREYGGTNDTSNLMPVPRSIHQLLITPWWVSYKNG